MLGAWKGREGRKKKEKKDDAHRREAKKANPN